MEALFASAVGVMVAAAVHLLLRARPFAAMVGLLLLTQAANLVVFAAGGLSLDAVPILGHGDGPHADPVAQALALTAIVISFATTAVVGGVAVAARMERDGNAGKVDDDAGGGGDRDGGGEPSP